MKKLMCFIICMSVIVLSCCTGRNNPEAQKISYEAGLYFANEQYNNIKVEKRTITYGEEDVLAREVLKALLEGPNEATSKRVIPENTKLLGFRTDGVDAYVDFSGEFNRYYGENKKSQELVARYSVVKTLCELPRIDRVEISVNGSPVLGDSGNPVGLIGEEDLIFSENENATQKYVTLYFADDMGENLVAVRRRAQLVDNSMEKTVLKELIQGPGYEKCYATIPNGVKVLSVETKEGICFVNFSKEFADNIGGGSSASTMAIYSVVNSLTELDEIEKVQFLIDGEKTEWLGEYDVSEPFERDESLVLD